MPADTVLSTMVYKSKWIEGVDVQRPVSTAARFCLSARLDLVWYSLRLAAQKGDDEPESVHQLRVSTRRAKATLECFRDLLPRRRTQWMDKRLTRLRRAAGDARDADVLLARLEANGFVSSSSGRAALIDRIRALRQDAQRPIVEQCEHLKKRGVKQRSRRLVEKTRWRDDFMPEPSFAEFACQAICAAAEPFLDASHQQLESVENLHAMRIRCKRLRYSMETFAVAFDASFRDELYPALVEVQEKLGHINDHAAAIAKFETWRQEWADPQVAEALDELQSLDEEQLETARQEFVAWWSPQRERAFRADFARHGCICPDAEEVA